MCLAIFFDKIVIEKQVEQLGTSELQFGYKTKSYTVMCSTALTETIEYYVSRKTPVYVLLIDASKAFDRVSHIKLFNTLQAHGVCPLIIRVLYNMYTNSDMQVRWKSELSNVFPLMNGVKQGGCLSPMLFTLYMDGLIQKLKHSGIGCHIGRTYCGVFGYADDLAIVSPTLFGLRQIIEICEEYASDMDLLFNPKKFKLLCYNMLLDVKPVVYLCDAIVDVVYSEMYLGNKLYNNIYKTKIMNLSMILKDEAIILFIRSLCAIVLL